MFTLFCLLHVFALLGSQKRDFDFFRARLFLGRGLSYLFRNSTPWCVDLSAWIWHWKSTVFLGDVCNQSCLLLLFCGSPQIVFKILLSGVCSCCSGSFCLVAESLGFTVQHFPSRAFSRHFFLIKPLELGRDGVYHGSEIWAEIMCVWAHQNVGYNRISSTFQQEVIDSVLSDFVVRVPWY